MFSVLTNDGLGALQLAKTSIDKVQFTKFRMGTFSTDLPDLNEDASNLSILADPAYLDIYFEEVYADTYEQMGYVPLSSKRVTLRCYVPPEAQDTFYYDSILLYGAIDGDEFIFSLHYYKNVNPKFNLELTEGGMKYYFLLTIDLPNQSDYFDFDNLQEDSVDFADFEEFHDIVHPLHSNRDQALLGEHINTPGSTPHVLINTMGQWYGTQTYDIEFDSEERDTILP